jgi:sugar phosphate isomerase/epimerase
MIPRLAVQEHLIAGGSLLEKWERAQKLGFEAIELRGGGGADFLQRLPELRQASKAGVVLPTVCTITDRFIGDIDPGRRDKALQGMKTLLSAIAELGGRGAITPAAFGRHSNVLPVFGSRRDPHEDRLVLLEMLSRLGDHARAEGVLVASPSTA